MHFLCERTYSEVRGYTESVLSIRQKGDGGFCVFVLRPPKLVRMRVRVRIRVHVTGGVLARGLTCVGRLSEQPHWRWPKQGAAVVKQGGLGELSGLCKVYRPKRRPAEGAVLFRPIMWLCSASVWKVQS